MCPRLGASFCVFRRCGQVVTEPEVEAVVVFVLQRGALWRHGIHLARLRRRAFSRHGRCVTGSYLPHKDYAARALDHKSESVDLTTQEANWPVCRRIFKSQCCGVKKLPDRSARKNTWAPETPLAAAHPALERARRMGSRISRRVQGAAWSNGSLSILAKNSNYTSTFTCAAHLSHIFGALSHRQHTTTRRSGLRGCVSTSVQRAWTRPGAII